jgi:hypothetical protein
MTSMDDFFQKTGKEPWNPGELHQTKAKTTIFGQSFLVMIIDEAHELRNFNTKIFQAAICLRSRSLHSVIATATPVPNTALVLSMMISFSRSMLI